MKKAACLGTALAAGIFLGAGSAAAQVVEFQWTPEHDRGVYSRVTRERVRVPPPAGFSVGVGAEVPADVEVTICRRTSNMRPCDVIDTRCTATGST